MHWPKFIMCFGFCTFFLAFNTNNNIPLKIVFIIEKKQNFNRLINNNHYFSPYFAFNVCHNMKVPLKDIKIKTLRKKHIQQ